MVIISKLKNVEKYIYKFLVKFNSNDFYSSFNFVCNKYKLEDNYVSSVVEECIKSNYIDGITSINSTNNTKHLNLREHIYITREGYKFIRQYRLNKFNFFWIPFKNLVVIVITAIITALATVILSG